jgi:rhodanese-related sulfurtransferase|tara:strand:+ start:320 stop:634 length:315 start_codon:yes stop_codon:yes gene_type:complete
VDQISVIDFSKVMNSSNDWVLLDVRTDEEFHLVNLGGIHIPLNELPQKFTQLDQNKKIYCLCHHGVRSDSAAIFLKSEGFANVYNIVGGIDAWSLYVDDTVLRY